MWGIGMRELLVILVIVLLIFGTKRVGQFGKDMGEAIRGFRGGFKDAKQATDEINEELRK